ncbi:MAG: isoprenylcysteine carboxylmethyltransferase family protein [bacterium]
MSYHFVVLGAAAALRLWEVIHSWRQLAAQQKEAQAQPLEEPFFPLMVALHAGWLAGGLAEVVLTRPLFHPWLVLPLLAVWAAALGLRFWVVLTLGAEWNVRVIRRKRQRVIVHGPYRFVRHPNYVALVLEIAAIPLLIGAYWTALLATVVNAALLADRIRREEAYLLQNSAYRKAFGGKKRFIPRVF